MVGLSALGQSAQPCWPLALASLEPNLVAHSSLVTTDIGVTLFIFLAVYLLWEYVNRPTWALLTATGISTGMALLSKFSAASPHPDDCIDRYRISFDRQRSRHVLLPLKAESKMTYSTNSPISSGRFRSYFCCPVLTIPPAYFFRGFATLAIRLSSISDFVTRRPARPFLRGIFSCTAWWSYFPVAFLIKTPIVGSLVLVIASLVFYRAGSPLTIALKPCSSCAAGNPNLPCDDSSRRRILACATFFPLYPFLFVLASRLATDPLTPRLAGTVANRCTGALHSYIFAPHCAAPACVF